MSGGYYDYTFSKDPYEINIDTLKRMANDLREHGYKDIAYDIATYAELLDIYKFNLAKMHKKLEKPMKVFEWYMSNDTLKEDMDKTAEEYLNNIN